MEPLPLPNRISHRLNTFDYRSGWFFVTACAAQRRHLFGKIREGHVELSLAGRLVEEEWLACKRLRSDVELDVYVIMPNHFHAILTIGGMESDLGKVMAQFKSVSSKKIKSLCGHEEPVWQRDYYDHVIRNDADLWRVRNYIVNNPLTWELDRENRDKVGSDEDENVWFAI